MSSSYARAGDRPEVSSAQRGLSRLTVTREVWHLNRSPITIAHKKTTRQNHVTRTTTHKLAPCRTSTCAHCALRQEGRQRGGGADLGESEELV